MFVVDRINRLGFFILFFLVGFSWCIRCLLYCTVLYCTVLYTATAPLLLEILDPFKNLTWSNKALELTSEHITYSYKVNFKSARSGE